MNVNPKVSIILTSYNHEKYICASIDSVLRQTFTDYELIIWDDGSADSSWKKITNYQDPRIRKFRNEINQRGGTLKQAIQDKAKGKYIAIHHSDDLWEESKLEKQVNFLNSHPAIGAVFTQVRLIEENGEQFSDQNHPYYGRFDQPNRSRFAWLRYFFDCGNALCHPSVLVRKTCYDDQIYRNGFGQLADFDLWVRFCLKYEIHILPEKLTLFRINRAETNTSGNRPDTRIRLQYELLKVLENYRGFACLEDLLCVFPEAEQYLSYPNPDLLYALGRVAVEHGLIVQAHLFGLNLLFEALNDPQRASLLKEHQNFNKKAFVEITKDHDIFAIEGNNQLREQMEELGQLRSEIAQLKRKSFWNLFRRVISRKKSR